jgi:pyruvate-ferredoxin/flavodoxin oxidoreductase
VANATGCSSIYGGNLPTTPWAVNAEGRGPAWSNSLFEDNAEFGLGFRVSIDKQAEFAAELLANLASEIGESLAADILNCHQVDEAEIYEQRHRVEALKSRLGELTPTTQVKMLLSVADYLVKKSVWIVGGDGWAYDIGYGGLDHVLASGRNVNILVMDTEVYSNTGGQASKATPREQTIKAFLEAEAYNGPSLIIAYSHCIAHGINMTTAMNHQKEVVESGRWLMYRYHPDLAKEGKNPLQLDSRAPKLTVAQTLYSENRFKMLATSKPEEAKRLLKEAQADVDTRWQMYQYLAAKGTGSNE